MSTPMFDMPEHLMIPVNAAGEGPLDLDDPAIDRWVCWCGQDDCKEAEL